MDEEKHKIIFLNRPKTKLLELAFNAVHDFEDLTSQWQSEQEVEEEFVSDVPLTVSFVCSDFSSTAFEYLKKFTNRIYGPQVILHYLREGKTIPQWNTPLFSAALIHATVTLTSFLTPERSELTRKIQMLHGIVFSDLTDEVNAIITSKVGSKKYLVGGDRKINILLPSWIEEAWNVSSIQDPIDMMSEIYLEKFRVPIFHNLVICISGLSGAERKEVNKLVSENGGQYSGELRVGLITHLVVHKPGGSKYDYAKRWKVQIVTLNWLTDSVSNGYAMNEDNYRVNEGDQITCSTPCKVNPSKFDLGDFSSINQSISKSRINETIMSGNSSFKSPLNYFLSDCVLIFLNCTNNQKSELSKLASSCGAKICLELQDQVSESVTHTIIGDANPKFKVKLYENSMIYVKPDWLFQCCEKRQKLPTSDFLYNPQQLEFEDINFDSIESHQKNISGLTSLSSAISMQDDESLLNQYFNFDDSVNQTQVPQNQHTFLNKKEFFYPLKFFLSSKITNSHLADQITKKDGIVLEVCHGKCDFHVYPYFPNEFIICNQSKPVTETWINYCFENNKLCDTELETEIGFQPIKLKENCLPLKNLVISMTGWTDFMRNHVKSLIVKLGAIFQDSCVKKDNPSRNLLACTHLLALKPEGKKYEAACVWGLPIVRISWLKESAQLGRPAPVTDHLFQPNLSKSQSNCLSQIATSKRINDLISKNKPQENVDPNSTLITASNTPTAKFLTRGVPYRSKVTLGGFGENSMPTPDWIKEIAVSKPETPLKDSRPVFLITPESEKVNRCLDRALAKTENLPKRGAKNELINANNIGEIAPSTGIMNEVVICVSNSLSHKQLQNNQLIKTLGGDYAWVYNKEITHMIADPNALAVSFSSQASLTIPEDIRTALAEGKFVVKSEWLTDSKENGFRLSESDYQLTEKDFYPTSNTPVLTKKISAIALDDCINSTASTDSFKNSPLPNVSNRTLNTLTPIMQTHDTSKNPEAVNQDQSLVSSSLMGDFNRRLESLLGPNYCQRETSSPSRRVGEKENIATADTVLLNQTVDKTATPDRKGGLGMGILTPTDPSHPRNHIAHHPKFYPDGFVGHGSRGNDRVRWRYDDYVVPDPVPGAAFIGPDIIAEFNSHSSQTLFDVKTGITSKGIEGKRIINIDSCEQKDHYITVIEKLGGLVDDSKGMNIELTHLIIPNPARNQRFFLSLAQGKWILHWSYIDACNAAGKWLPEESYEWGQVATDTLLNVAKFQSPVITPPNSNLVKMLAKAATYWRKKGGKAFKDWNVVFFPADWDKVLSFQKIIEVGGGTVIPLEKADPSQVTHAFCKARPECQSSAPKNFSWMKIEYLSDFLTGCGEVPDKNSFLMLTNSKEISDISRPMKNSRIHELDSGHVAAKRSRR